MLVLTGRHLHIFLYYIVDRDYKVHHINRKRADNRIENLWVMTLSEHSRYHKLEEDEHTRSTLDDASGEGESE